MASKKCVVENCKSTIHNKVPGVTFHPCPTNNEMRSKWMKILKNRCSRLDWVKSKICSKHFENRYFDSQRRLRDYAIPTLFGPYVVKVNMENKPRAPSVSKVDCLITKMTQDELTDDVKNSYARLKEPSNLDVFVNDDLHWKPDAPMEAKLWLLVKKQDNLITRLMDLVVQTKKHVDILQNSAEELKTLKKEHDHDVESMKYMVQCLQEKQATLEEQIEILTAVESR